MKLGYKSEQYFIFLPQSFSQISQMPIFSLSPPPFINVKFSQILIFSPPPPSIFFLANSHKFFDHMFSTKSTGLEVKMGVFPNPVSISKNKYCLLSLF